MARTGVHATLRLVVGPLGAASLSGIMLAQYGRAVAAFGAYLVLVAAHASVVLWARYRLHRALERLAALRVSRR